MPVGLEKKLAANRYNPGTTSHIIPCRDPDAAAAALLVKACPAGLFSLSPQGELKVNFHGCLECGTCRALCGPLALSRWRYPEAGNGLFLRYG